MAMSLQQHELAHKAITDAAAAAAAPATPSPDTTLLGAAEAQSSRTSRAGTADSDGLLAGDAAAAAGAGGSRGQARFSSAAARRDSERELDQFMDAWRRDNVSMRAPLGLVPGPGLGGGRGLSGWTLEARLRAIASAGDFAYCIFWGPVSDRRAARAAAERTAVGIGTSDARVAADKLYAEPAKPGLGPGVLVAVGSVAEPRANCDVELFLRVCTAWGFSMGLGMIGRVALTGQPEWWRDVRALPSGVFHRQAICTQTGMVCMAAAQAAGGVVEVGGPDVRTEDPAILRIIEATMEGFAADPDSANKAVPFY